MKRPSSLQYCQIKNNLIDCIYDKSKLKQNKFTSGTNFLIKKTIFYKQKKSRLFIITKLNLIKEIKKRIQIYKKWGKFIIPYQNQILFINKYESFNFSWGFGTRLSEYTDNIPKPMIPIGGRPIIEHIMSIYSKYQFNEFVVALGYKGDVIKDC